MTDIRIDVTAEEVEGLQIENEGGFDWVVTLGNLSLVVTGEQIVALGEAINQMFGDEA